jgi:predicted pyridoxine 5'-phosphate oxidase superfamily flavin-nucleotide-binding protein
MGTKFLDLAVTDSVRKAQEHYFGNSPRFQDVPERDTLTDEEVQFIQSRDSFYLGTVSEIGWPYIQHRGGAPGFLRVMSPTQLAFADYGGNRQMLSTGNLAVNDRVVLFLMDYPRRERLKILGHARVEDAREHPGLVADLAEPERRGTVERLFLVEVVAFNWNCPKYITPRLTAAEIDQMVAPLRQRITELEAELRKKK